MIHCITFLELIRDPHQKVKSADPMILKNVSASGCLLFLSDAITSVSDLSATDMHMYNLLGSDCNNVDYSGIQ